MQNEKMPPQQVPFKFTCGKTFQTHNQFKKSNAMQISFLNMHELSRSGSNEEITIPVTSTAIKMSQPLHSCTTPLNLPSATNVPAVSWSSSSIAADSNALQMESNISEFHPLASRPL